MKLKVLVLDDDEGLLKGLEGMVEELNHIPLIAKSAEDAFSILEDKGPVEVILADVRLPGISGIDFMKEAQKKHSDTAVILMTAFSDIDLAVMALETGAFGFLRKPFALKELEVMLRNVTNNRRLKQHNRGMRKLLGGLEVINSHEPSTDDLQLDTLLDVALDTTRSTSGSILLLSRDGKNIEAAAHRGLDEDMMDNLKKSLVDSIAAEVLQMRETVILDDQRVAPDSPFHSLMNRPDIFSSISSPIESEKRVLGVLNLNRTRDGDHFDDSDRHLANVFANTLALAIENSRLRADQIANWENLQKMQRQLIQTEKLSSLGQLAAGIAHEINNPLTSVMGFAELLMRKMKDPASTEFLQKIVTNSERIKRILLDLKDFYVPSKNRMGCLKINRIIENAIPIARVHPEASGVSIKKSLASDLPPLHCDENQILQVLINLIINAFQAMPEGGEVLIESTFEDGYIVVSVKDDGVGIPGEHLNKIFDPFFTTKSDWKGTGLGLSVCYTIVDNHGGEIEASSVVGEGTSFTLKLPASDSDRGDGDLEDLSRLDQGRRGRILVVDDEADCRDLLKTVLDDLGFDIDEAHNGSAAIDLFRSSSDYKLVFLDYKMPDLNGAETYRRLKSIDPDIKVIVLTGSIGQSAKMIVELGAQGFITKPFKVNEIEEQIDKVLDRKTVF